jgi:hypothetical protein
MSELVQAACVIHVQGQFEGGPRMRTRIVVPVAAACAAAAVLGAGALASGRDASSAPTAAQEERANRVLFAVLTGRKEVDAEGNRRAGDLDGRGSFSGTVDGDQLCFGITVKDIDAPGAAHIHKGRPNQAGGVVIPLVHPTTGDPGASSDCITVDETLIGAILKNPHRYYVNVHTTAFGGGAVRGQLFRRTR